ncbi:MAG: FAD-binding oxidoreductase, partial [Coraliomargarita sp.]
MMSGDDSKQGSKRAGNALRALRRKLPGRVAVDEASRFDASLDNLRLSFLPDAVIRVKEASEVGRALEVAHKYGVPVTARGAGSSATGSAVPLHGG